MAAGGLEGLTASSTDNQQGNGDLYPTTLQPQGTKFCQQPEQSWKETHSILDGDKGGGMGVREVKVLNKGVRESVSEKVPSAKTERR